MRRKITIPSAIDAKAFINESDWSQNHTGLKKRIFYYIIKRLFDIVVSLFGLCLLSIPFCFVAIAIKLDSDGPVFFKQLRVGRNLKHFTVWKFRTMTIHQLPNAPVITIGEDPRITNVGSILRRFKIDELPQLLNVFLGQMSFVGPRPEVPIYVDQYLDAFKALLIHRPGITDLASLIYRDEANLLVNYDFPDEAYINSILPHKLLISIFDRRTATIFTDLETIFRTILGKPPVL